MTRSQARALHLSTASVALTGLVYGWMRYFAQSEDPFALAAHPWQPHAQHLHVLLAPLFVFAAGLVWPSHVWARLRSGFRARRRSGLWLALLLGPMVATGYLLQVSSDERWRRVWIVLHVASSLAWCTLYLAHQLAPREARASA